MKEEWRNLPIGATIEEGGTAMKFKTGDWRTKRPVLDKSKCINCLLCFIYCPDSAVIVKDGKIDKIDLDYCKGCGICSEVCPKKAIKMVRER
jgi:pyruvate ferredoxin oxidoreductase delta subunit